MYAQPGKKLLFMGGEFGQWSEWAHDTSFDWDLLDQPFHGGCSMGADLNISTGTSRRSTNGIAIPAASNGSIATTPSQAWSAPSQREDGVALLVVCNFTPVPRHSYRVGAPHGGLWQEVLNSDAAVTAAAPWAILAASKPRRFAARAISFLDDHAAAVVGVVFQERGLIGVGFT